MSTAASLQNLAAKPKALSNSTHAGLLLQRKCACGSPTASLTGECAECKSRKRLQTKLAIGASNDPLEQEADRVADQVMAARGYAAVRGYEQRVDRVAAIPTSGGTLQRLTLGNAPVLRRDSPPPTPSPRDPSADERRKYPGSSLSDLGFNDPKNDQHVQQPPEKPETNEDRFGKAGEKLAETFLDTALGKELTDKALQFGEGFVSTLPGFVATGGIAASTIAAMTLRHQELPIQLPVFKLTAIAPGLKVKLTYKGPLNAPTEAGITFTYEPGAGKKAEATESDRFHAETGHIAADQAKFREGTKTPAERAAEQRQLDAIVRARQAQSGNLLGIPGLTPRRDDAVLQRDAIGSGDLSVAPPIVHDVLRSPGQPLDPTTRSFMEPRFGHDFSRVRVHTDERAVASAREVSANAFTVGHNIVFDSGRFAPGTHEGRRLIAHELTHVVQQSGSDGIRVSQGGEKGGLSPIAVLEPAMQRAPLSETGDGLIQRDTEDASPSVEAGPPTSDEPDLAPENELYTLILERTKPVRNPTIEEARLALMHDFIERGMFDLAAQLETAKVVAGPLLPSGAETEEFVHPDRGTVVRFRRNWSFLNLMQPYVTVYWLPIPVKDKTSPAIGPAAGGGGTAIADPLADLYRAKFPPKAGDKTSDHVDTLMKVQLALELCDATAMGELMEAFKGAIRDPAFYITTGLMVPIYVGLWLTPDPTMLTKIAVGVFTAIMLIMFTWEDLIGFAGAWLTLEAACKSATTEDELRAAGDTFLAKLGQVGFDVLLMLLFHGVEKGVGPKVRGGARGRAIKRADATAAALRAEPGASMVGKPLKATPERAALLPNAKTAAGEGASPTGTLDALSDALPTHEAKRGLSKLRAEKTDAETLQRAENKQRNENDLVNWLTEQGMTKEQKALAKERASQAEADAAWQRIQQLRSDPALPEQTKRAGWVRNILILIEALGFESKRLRSAVEEHSVSKVAGIIAEIMARAELGRRIKGIKGMEIQYDIELARKVEGYTSVNEWLQAQKEAWEANGKQGKEPDSRTAAPMRTRGGEVWESLGQADNMICERGADGKASIKLLEETKSGGETAEKATSQARRFLNEFTEMDEGRSEARLFQRGPGATLGAEHTGDFNLSSAKTATVETRGLKGREGFTSNLDVDRPALEAAADALIKKGLQPDVAGPPPLIPLRDDRPDPEPVP